MFVYQPPQTPWLDILYQDEHFIIVNKQAGLLTVPGKAPEHADSLILRVLRALPTARIVHRLDMATSGLIIIALNKKAQSHISRQFELRQVHKGYEAIVSGRLTPAQGEVTLPLRCDWPNRPKQMVDEETGKAAHTNFQLIHHEGHNSRVQLEPITGRSHQLRVHMLALGHPILGDRLYGPRQTKPTRLHLHATSLSFLHPAENRTLYFTSPAPF